MRIYLDNCCYGRPYDDQASKRIISETQSILNIRKHIRNGDIVLATSYILHYENNRKKNIDVREKIAEFMSKNRSIHIGIDNVEKLTEMTAKIMKTGIKNNDAYHLASAILANCDYFLTTDDRLLKYQTNEIKLLNPVDFNKFLEANDDV